jgi:hypothetical protein
MSDYCFSGVQHTRQPFIHTSIYPEPCPLTLKMPTAKFTNHQRAGLLKALSQLKASSPQKEFVLFYLAELK